MTSPTLPPSPTTTREPKPPHASWAPENLHRPPPARGSVSLRTTIKNPQGFLMDWKKLLFLKGWADSSLGQSQSAQLQLSDSKIFWKVH